MIIPGAHVTPTVRLVRPLGAGGMGSVWVAEHLALQTNVVVKFMSPELAREQANVARFGREAAAASQVKSPHVVQMFDHGVGPDGVPFIVMELLEGHDVMWHLKQRGRFQPQEVATILVQTCKALSKAHEKGIVHRDIKPENIFVLEGDEIFVKLLDFGIAKAAGALSSHTGTGAMIGTPFYMSPEQIVGAHGLDFRADLWSLGIVAFELLTGKKPFEADTIGGLAVQLHNPATPLPSQLVPDLAPAIDEWFLRACARSPDERFQSAKEMATSFLSAAGNMSASMLARVPASIAATQPMPMQTSSGWGATPPPSRPQPEPAPPPAPAPPTPFAGAAQQPSFPGGPPQGSFPGAPPQHLAGPAPLVPSPGTSGTSGTFGASTNTPAPAAPARSKAPLVVGIIVLLLLLGGGGAAVFLLLEGGDAKKEAASASSADDVPEPAPKKKKKKTKPSADEPATAEPEPEPAPKPPPTPTAAPVAKPKPAPTAAPTGTATLTPTPTAAPTPTPKPVPTGKKPDDDDIK
ncbi:MAG: protein kinase [Deltaproteobacteria bacterium]|nr:protein kinase [Deltaproteobacteria bacterium]